MMLIRIFFVVKKDAIAKRNLPYDGYKRLLRDSGLIYSYGKDEVREYGRLISDVNSKILSLSTFMFIFLQVFIFLSREMEVNSD
jgi:hypothetical protein